MYDSLIKGARVVDPSQALDSIKDVALAQGKVRPMALPGDGELPQ